mgnify:CR=1 FL=1
MLYRAVMGLLVILAGGAAAFLGWGREALNNRDFPLQEPFELVVVLAGPPDEDGGRVAAPGVEPGRAHAPPGRGGEARDHARVREGPMVGIGARGGERRPSRAARPGRARGARSTRPTRAATRSTSPTGRSRSVAP